jgi:hypothetical protein
MSARDAIRAREAGKKPKPVVVEKPARKRRVREPEPFVNEPEAQDSGEVEE